jgi:integrase
LQGDLDPYEAWLRRRGAGSGTIKQYRMHAARTINGQDVFDRLTDRSLSPKYRRMCRAAALSFARFNKDAALIEELGDVRLPAPVRKTAKVPLSESAWKAVRAEIDAADYLKEPIRAVLGLMSTRGLRSGDVLRLKRSEISSALKTGVLSYVAKGERRLEFGVLKSFRPYLELLEAAFSGTRASAVCDLIALRASAETKMTAAAETVSRMLTRVGEAVGDDLEVDPDELHPHKLRRTYATLYYEACGRDPMKLKQHMCWSSIETAMSYVDHDQRDELDLVADKMLR